MFKPRRGIRRLEVSALGLRYIIIGPSRTCPSFNSCGVSLEMALFRFETRGSNCFNVIPTYFERISPLVWSCR